MQDIEMNNIDEAKCLFSEPEAETDIESSSNIKRLRSENDDQYDC